MIYQMNTLLNMILFDLNLFIGKISYHIISLFMMLKLIQHLHCTDLAK